VYRQPDDLSQKSFFWTRLVSTTAPSGGHGKDEYLGPPDQLSDWIGRQDVARRATPQHAEMTRRMSRVARSPLCRITPSGAVKHILRSSTRRRPRVLHGAVGPAVTQEYQDMFPGLHV